MGSRLPNASTRMSLLHAWFGAGATISPFISTLFVKHVPQAYRYYLVAAAVAIVVTRTADQIVKMDDNDNGEEGIPLNPSGQEVEREVVEKKKQQGSGDKMWTILKMPAVYAIVIYMFIYVSRRFCLFWFHRGGADC
jgi:fucose permease